MLCAGQPIPLKDLLKLVKPADFWAEGLAVLFMLVYTANIFFGSRANKRIATAWVEEYAREGQLLPRNFAHVGLREYPSVIDWGLCRLCPSARDSDDVQGTQHKSLV